MKDKIIRYCLVLLALFAVCFASFSKADLQVIDTLTKNINGSDEYINSNSDFVCFTLNSCTSYPAGDYVLFVLNPTSTTWNYGMKWNGNTSNASQGEHGMGYCSATKSIYLTTASNCNITFRAYKSVEYTSLQCQTNYSLIPISSVDQNYCTTNNLCPSSGTPSDCPNVGVSNLFINDIFHPGAFNIIMNIPEEIDWDYAYTNSGTNMNIDVVGYNQDTEYIEGLIDVQNYKPTSEDFSKVFLNFSNFGTLLIACLFVILVFYFVKKMFK